MADQVITITVPDAKVSKFVEGYLELYPNVEKNEDGSSKYTTAQWIREKVRRLVKRDAMRGLQVKASRESKVTDDDSMVE
jgi:hypothetical protein